MRLRLGQGSLVMLVVCFFFVSFSFTLCLDFTLVFVRLCFLFAAIVCPAPCCWSGFRRKHALERRSKTVGCSGCGQGSGGGQGWRARPATVEAAVSPGLWRGSHEGAVKATAWGRARGRGRMGVALPSRSRLPLGHASLATARDRKGENESGGKQSSQYTPPDRWSMGQRASQGAGARSPVGCGLEGVSSSSSLPSWTCGASATSRLLPVFILPLKTCLPLREEGSSSDPGKAGSPKAFQISQLPLLGSGTFSSRRGDLEVRSVAG